jgi:hypothetical protein
MEELRIKYADSDVAFVTMYVREPHPHERGFPDVSQPMTYDEKLQHAKQLIEVKDVHMPVVIDNIDQANHQRLGNLPNMSYVVDKEGIVQHAAEWLRAEDGDETLARLVTADDPSNPVLPTVDSDRLDSSI